LEEAPEKKIRAYEKEYKCKQDVIEKVDHLL
jgi:hypothetical protein